MITAKKIDTIDNTKIYLAANYSFLAGYNPIKDVILLGSEWLTYTKDEQMAIIYHELGHKHYKHDNTRTITNEIEADSYVTLKGLKDVLVNLLKSRLTLHTNHAHIEELNSRLIHLT